MVETKKGGFAHHNVKVRRVIPHASAPTDGYYPDQVAAAYGYPKGVSPTGRIIGIVELGGDHYLSDTETACQARGVSVPQITVIQVNGAAITPDPNGADVEVALDVQNAAMAFPGCPQRLYFCNNTEADFIAGVQQALNECDEVICCWGAPENQWSASGLQQMSSVITTAKAAGKHFHPASGDSGSGDGEKGKNVDFPGSAPDSVTWGGTTLPAGSNGLPNLAAETAWPDSGGGISSQFSKPSYQAGETVSGSMRGVPDAAMCADPNTPYNIFNRSSGGWLQVGGTSGAAPMGGTMFCLLKAQNGGTLPTDIHPLLYAAGACRDIQGGSNGAYQAGPGYDLVTGNGVPIYSALLAAIQGQGSTPPVTTSPPPASPPPPSSPPAAPTLPVPLPALEQLIQELVADLEADLEAILGSLGSSAALLDLSAWLLRPSLKDALAASVRARVTAKVQMAVQAARAKKPAA